MKQQSDYSNTAATISETSLTPAHLPFICMPSITKKCTAVIPLPRNIIPMQTLSQSRSRRVVLPMRSCFPHTRRISQTHSRQKTKSTTSSVAKLHLAPQRSYGWNAVMNNREIMILSGMILQPNSRTGSLMGLMMAAKKFNVLAVWQYSVSVA